MSKHLFLLIRPELKSGKAHVIIVKYLLYGYVPLDGILFSMSLVIYDGAAILSF